MAHNCNSCYTGVARVIVLEGGGEGQVTSALEIKCPTTTVKQTEIFGQMGMRTVEYYLSAPQWVGTESTIQIFG